MKILIFFISTCVVMSRMLRQNIQYIPSSPSSASATGDGPGFTLALIPQPVGNTYPPGESAAEVYKTFQPSFGGPIQMNWAPDPNAFNFDVAPIHQLNPLTLGSNFRMLMTARPQFPVLN